MAEIDFGACRYIVTRADLLGLETAKADAARGCELVDVQWRPRAGDFVECFYLNYLSDDAAKELDRLTLRQDDGGTYSLGARKKDKPD